MPNETNLYDICRNYVRSSQSGQRQYGLISRIENAGPATIRTLISCFCEARRELKNTYLQGTDGLTQAVRSGDKTAADDMVAMLMPSIGDKAQVQLQPVAQAITDVLADWGLKSKEQLLRDVQMILQGKDEEIWAMTLVLFEYAFPMSDLVQDGLKIVSSAFTGMSGQRLRRQIVYVELAQHTLARAGVWQFKNDIQRYAREGGQTRDEYDRMVIHRAYAYFVMV